MVASTPNRDARHSPRVLIVEDDAKYAFELVRTLKNPSRRSGFEIDVASTVEQAMAYLERDAIDIYVVDMGIPMREGGAPEDARNGKNLVRQIVERSNAGVIVHSNTPIGDDAEELLVLGADDYLEKGVSPEIVRAKAEALWRRIVMSRPNTAVAFVHARRTFRFGHWRFVVGERDLKSDIGEIIRLSPTEHAFLRYLCIADDHEIDRREFNVGVLGRPAYEQDRRIDNLVYRIREKLGENVPILSKGDGAYKLMDVTELRSK